MESNRQFGVSDIAIFAFPLLNRGLPKIIACISVWSMPNQLNMRIKFFETTELLA